MTNALASVPRNTAKPFGVGTTPLMFTVTTSFCMARKGARRAEKAQAAEPSLEAEKTDAPIARLCDHRGAIQNEHFSGFESGRFHSGFFHDLKRALPEARDVEAVVLLRFHSFNEERFVALQTTGAANHFIGALESF